jgi:hypothetical protein
MFKELFNIKLLLKAGACAGIIWLSGVIVLIALS